VENDRNIRFAMAVWVKPLIFSASSASRLDGSIRFRFPRYSTAFLHFSPLSPLTIATLVGKQIKQS